MPATPSGLGRNLYHTLGKKLTLGLIEHGCHESACGSGGMGGCTYFETRVQVNVRGQLHAVSTGESASGTDWIGGWVGPTDGLNTVLEAGWVPQTV